MDVEPAGDLRAEINYGNHPTTELHAEAIRANIIEDIVYGRGLVFRRSFVTEIHDLWVSPLGVVEGRKLRIIHDLAFTGSATARA